MIDGVFPSLLKAWFTALSVATIVLWTREARILQSRLRLVWRWAHCISTAAAFGVIVLDVSLLWQILAFLSPTCSTFLSSLFFWHDRSGSRVRDNTATLLNHATYVPYSWFLVCPPDLEIHETHVLLGVWRHFKVPGHSTQCDLFPGSIGKVIRPRLRIDLCISNFHVASGTTCERILTR